MTAIRTVLCPVDFSPATRRQVTLASDLCRAFGARLVLHHNQGHLSVGAGVGWMWAARHPTASHETIDAELQDLLAGPATHHAAEARITRGQASAAIAALADEIDADLVVLSTHGASTDDHTSVAEQVLAWGRRTVLTLHDADLDCGTPTFTAGGPRQIVLVPTDLTAESRAAVDLAVELARRLPLDLHLLHLTAARGSSGDAMAAEADAVRERLRALVADDLRDRAAYHVVAGDAAAGIVESARDLGAAFVVMGEHTREPLRRWFSRDTSRAVLHKAPCPVWYVPGRRTA